MQNEGSLSGIQSGDTLKKRFVVFNCLGKGGFGAVYEVYDWQRNEECALKMEFVKQDKESSLKIEVSALKRLQHSHYFPRFIESGQYHKCNYIVMQLVGQNLRDLCKHCPKGRFSLDTSIRLSLECLKAIESMHASGMLHRDIKPHNFTIGTTPADSRQIYLLDFGLVRRFTTKENTIRRQRPSAGFRGTVKYCSINVHHRKDQGRNDDLYSWMYMLIEFLNGSLPWEKEFDRDEVADLKLTTKKRMLANLLPEIRQLYDSIAKLNYSDEPPYHKYKKVFWHLFKKLHINFHLPFDWEFGLYPDKVSKHLLSAVSKTKTKGSGEKMKKHQKSKKKQNESSALTLNLTSQRKNMHEVFNILN